MNYKKVYNDNESSIVTVLQWCGYNLAVKYLAADKNAKSAAKLCRFVVYRISITYMARVFRRQQWKNMYIFQLPGCETANKLFAKEAQQ